MGVPIFFHMPGRYLPNAEREASWTSGKIPELLGGGKAASAQSWIYQTWAELRELCPVELVTEMPDEGIIITLGNFLHTGFRAGPSQFVAAVVADFLPHPGAQVQILQNAAHARRLPGAIFMPHWPQPNLVPRNPLRGPVVETAAFFGDPANLAPEIADGKFSALLERETGVRLEMRGAGQWHDFSNTDLVLAIRDFSRAAHLGKPATKLYNAWLAGVPLIGGCDSAFAAEGTRGTDYLVAGSPAECLSLIAGLKENPAAWTAIANAGKTRAAARSREAVRALWRDLCASGLPARREAWKKNSPLQQTAIRQVKRGIFFLDKKIRS